MKGFITPTYTFDASAKTVDLSNIIPFDIKRLVAIINQTDGVLIYSTASPDLKFTDVTSGVVTLNFDTTSMSDTDVLQIIYDVPAGSNVIDPQPVYITSNALTPSAKLITLGTAGTAVNATTDGSAASSRRIKLIIRAHEDNTGDLFLGGSDVDTTDGYKLFGPEAWVFDNDSSDYYIVSNVDSQKFYIMETKY